MKGAATKAGGSGSGDERMKTFFKIKQEFPLTMGTSSKDALTLSSADIARSIADSVRAIFPSGYGYGSGALGKGAIKAKLRIPTMPQR